MLKGGSFGDRAFPGVPGFFFSESLYPEALRNTDDVEENENMHPGTLNSLPESPH